MRQQNWRQNNITTFLRRMPFPCCWFDALVALLVLVAFVAGDSARIGEDSVGNLELSSRPGRALLT